MKHLFVGDTHGRSYWKIPILGHDPVTNTGSKYTIDDFDKVVFTGDYVDSHEVDITSDMMVDHLKELIDLKLKYPEKVTLLIGNHDLHYIFDPARFECSGFNSEVYEALHAIYNANIDLFDAMYQYKDHISSHAGIHVGWLKYRFNKYITDLEEPIADAINYEFNRFYDIYTKQISNLPIADMPWELFDVGYLRGGRQKVGGPFWVDRRLSQEKPAKGYHQIVGHTPVKHISEYPRNDSTSITYIDVMGDMIDDCYYIKNIE